MIGVNIATNVTSLANPPVAAVVTQISGVFRSIGQWHPRRFSRHNEAKGEGQGEEGANATVHVVALGGRHSGRRQCHTPRCDSCR